MAKDPLDERNFRQHWQGKRTKMADVLTCAEVQTLDDVAALTREHYDGPDLGSRHEYPPVRTPKVHGHAPPDWLIEQRRLERGAYWLQRAADHASAMALDQAKREQRFHAAPEDVTPTFRPRKGQRTLTMYCDCGHSGHVILSGRPRPWRLRCSQCGVLQEL